MPITCAEWRCKGKPVGSTPRCEFHLFAAQQGMIVAIRQAHAADVARDTAAATRTALKAPR